MIEVYRATGRKDTDRPYVDPITRDDLECAEDEIVERIGGSA